MARSTYIYILLGKQGNDYNEVQAAFTVKHEMHTWAERKGGIDKFILLRVRDGGREC